MGPAAHQPPGLIIEMGELDLQPALRGRRALAENLQDEPGAVDHLGLGLVLEILLLDRADRRVDDQQFGLGLAHRVGDPLDLAAAEQGGGPRLADPEMKLVLDRDADRLGEARGLLQPRRDVAPRARAELGQSDNGAGAARIFAGFFAVENAQPVTPRPGPRRN